MTSTTRPPAAPVGLRSPDAGLYRRATVLALVFAPALLLADNLLHPKEFRPSNESRQLTEIAAHVERWQLAHVLGFLAILLYAVVMLGLAFYVRGRDRRLGLAGGALGVAGLLGLAGAIALDGFTWGALGETYASSGADQPTVEAALDEVQNSSWSLAFYTLPAAWIAGMAALGIGLVRGRAVPVWAAVLFVIAALAVGTETIVVSNAYFIAGAAWLLVAGIAVAVPLARMSDEAFGGAFT